MTISYAGILRSTQLSSELSEFTLANNSIFEMVEKRLQ